MVAARRPLVAPTGGKSGRDRRDRVHHGGDVEGLGHAVSAATGSEVTGTAAGPERLAGRGRGAVADAMAMLRRPMSRSIDDRPFRAVERLVHEPHIVGWWWVTGSLQ
jgi:hypothetical protein